MSASFENVLHKFADQRRDGRDRFLFDSDARLCCFGGDVGGVLRIRGFVARGHGDTLPLALTRMSPVIFKRVHAGRPYPDHGLTQHDWAELSPTQVHLDELIATKTNLDLEHLLDEDSTYFGDLFAHIVKWNGELYLEDGLHRAVRAALQQRNMLHARVHTIGKHL